MTTPQQARARAFAALHVKGDPVILFNAWDAGSAKAVADAGATAIATGSWSMAGAWGYPDGEQIPLDAVCRVVERIVQSVDLPVSVDFESGYARGGEALEENVARIVETGAVGFNFEDQWVGQGVIYCTEEQVARIATARRGADRAGVPVFINARTDIFLRSDPVSHAGHVDEAITRAKAYADAGGNGFFVPGLRDESLIARVCEASPLPVNVLFHPELPPARRLAELGVARLSYGPRPWREMMAALTEAARAAFAAGDRR
jgi:2-methylisocitrate lyase-like PEP mutase family enzyme